MLTETATTDEPAVTLRIFILPDEDLPAFRDMKFEDINELHLDHPGANDQEYRERRDYIASLAKKFRETGVITDVDYTEEEQGIWRHVAGRLEELHEKHASPFYLTGKKTWAFRTTASRSLSEMNRRLKELTGFRLAPIEGSGRNRAFLSWLSYRMMLSTQYIRHHSRPEYTPEPDIVHESIGHIPMFTNPEFRRLFAVHRPRRTHRERSAARRTRPPLLVHRRIRPSRTRRRHKSLRRRSALKLRRARARFLRQSRTPPVRSRTGDQPRLHLLRHAAGAVCHSVVRRALKEITRKYIESF